MSTYRVRSLAALVVLCLMTSLFSACSGSRKDEKGVDIPEMARIIADSMQDISSAEDLYKLIPDDQKDGITYSEYYEYISILQKMMPHISRIESFEIIEGQEKATLLNEMIDASSEEYASLIRSCVPIRVTTTGQRKSGEPIIIYLQTLEDGTVYLNHRWITNCMDLYAFSVHYFEAYTNENLTDVKRLLRSTETAEAIPNSDTIVEAKANEMIRFYSVNVKSVTDEFELVSVDASNLVYLQPEVLDASLHARSREVHFHSSAEDVITVSDPIANELKTTDLYLYYNGHRTIRIGDHTTASSITTMFGEPISVTCGPVLDGGSKKENRQDGSRRILVRYPGFTITVYGHFTNEKDWEGNCVRFRIWDTKKASIGERVTTTETSWGVLEQYPFADETNYRLNVTVDGDAYELEITLDKDHTNGNGSYPVKSLMLSEK